MDNKSNISNGVDKKNLIIILLVLIIILLAGAAGYLLILKKFEIPTSAIQSPKTCSQEAKVCPDGSSVGRTGPNCEFAACPAVQNNSSQQQTQSQSADNPVAQKGAVYTNSDYGFKLNLPEGFEKYKIMIEKEPFEKGISYVFVLLPTTESSYVAENRVTHEKFPGYESIFAVTAWDKTVWDKEINSAECKNNPNPGCPFASEILGKTAKYVFDLSLPNGVPSADLEQLEVKARADNAKILRDAFELTK